MAVSVVWSLLFVLLCLKMVSAVGPGTTVSFPLPLRSSRPPADTSPVCQLMDLPAEILLMVFERLFDKISLRPQDDWYMTSVNRFLHPVDLNPYHITAIFLVCRRLNGLVKDAWWKCITLHISSAEAMWNNMYWRGSILAMGPHNVTTQHLQAQAMYRQACSQLRRYEQVPHLPIHWGPLHINFPELRSITISPLLLNISRHPISRRARLRARKSINLLEHWCLCIDELQAVGSGQSIEKPMIVEVGNPMYKTYMCMFLKHYWHALLLQCSIHGIDCGSELPWGEAAIVWPSGTEGTHITPMDLKSFQEDPEQIPMLGIAFEGTRWLKQHGHQDLQVTLKVTVGERILDASGPSFVAGSVCFSCQFPWKEARLTLRP